MEDSAAGSVIKTPKTVGIAVTGRCNLKCRYCFYANEMTALSDLSTEDWLAFFKELSRLGVMDVTLSGGEAFSRPDLFELIDGLIANRMRYCILSNGTLIDEAVLRQFEIGKRRLRLNYIQVSIDGASAEIHNKSRPHSFDRALRGLRLLKEAGFPVAVRVTINRHNLNDLRNIARLLLEEIGLPHFSTNEAMPVGSGCRNEADISLTPDEELLAMEILDRLQVRYPGRLKAQAGPQAKKKMYEQMEHARQTGEKAKDWVMGYLTACGCVFTRIDILHDGTIVPCHMLPGLHLGNVVHDSIGKIWLHHPVMKAMRDRRHIPMHQAPGCKDCQWAPYCNGSCPGLAHQLTGNFNRANPKDCYKTFLFETRKKHAV